MKHLKLVVEVLLSIPKSVFLNFKVLPFKQAAKLPMLVHYRTKICQAVRGGVIIKGNISPFMIKFGFGGTVCILAQRRNIISFEKNGRVIFEGAAHFGEGFSVCNHGNLTFGKNFNINKNAVITCGESITFGDNVLGGWNVVVRDADGHKILWGGAHMPSRKPVVVGNHVWICAEAHIMKGSTVPDNCIVGYRSLVNKEFSEESAVIAGAPAAIVKRDIGWER